MKKQQAEEDIIDLTGDDDEHDDDHQAGFGEPKLSQAMDIF
jgi:hypothetical protein